MKNLRFLLFGSAIVLLSLAFMPPAPEGSITILGTSVSFDGIDDYFDRGMKTAQMFSNPFTLTFDLTPADTLGRKPILDNQALLVFIDVGAPPSDPVLVIDIPSVTSAKASITLGVAHQVAITADEIGGDVVFDIYLDGAFASTGSGSGVLPLAAHNLIVGTNHENPPLPFGAEFYDGLLGPISLEEGVIPP